MAEKVYIELDEIVDAINHRRDSAAASKDLRTMHELNCLLEVIQDRDCFPAADVAPVKHGHWVYNRNGMDWNLGAWECSACKRKNNNLPGSEIYSPYSFVGSRYCPNCGAKMGEVTK